MMDTIICAIISDTDSADGADGAVIVAVDGGWPQSTALQCILTAAGATEATVAAGTDVDCGKSIDTNTQFPVNIDPSM
jgi:hypothetical protein